MTRTVFFTVSKFGKRSASCFGTHRQAYNPKPSFHAGGRIMPTAWQYRGTPQSGNHHQYGVPVRSFAEILIDPLRKMIVTNRPRHRVLAAVFILALLILIFCI